MSKSVQAERKRKCICSLPRRSRSKPSVAQVKSVQAEGTGALGMAKSGGQWLWLPPQTGEEGIAAVPAAEVAPVADKQFFALVKAPARIPRIRPCV